MKVRKSVAFILLVTATVTGYAIPGPSTVSATDAEPAPGSSVGSTNYRLSSRLPGSRDGAGGGTLPGREVSLTTLERLLSRKVSAFIVNGATICAALADTGIWRSVDGGATWSAPKTPPANGRIRGLAAHPASLSTVYAATNGGGIFTSRDAGNTWTACGAEGFPAAALNAVSLAVDPAGNVYAGTEAGIFMSSDCTSWKAVNKGLQVSAAAPPVAIAVDPAAPKRLYAGLDGAGIFTSGDRGKTWAPAAIQPKNRRIRALAVNPVDNARLYAATYGNGVITSTDHGVTWLACKNAGLADLKVGSLLLDADGTLYAGTDRGVFMSRDGCAGWTTLLGGDPQ